MLLEVPDPLSFVPLVDHEIIVVALCSGVNLIFHDTLKETRDPNWTHGPIKRKKGTWRGAKSPLRIEMVPLKLFFMGYPRERISFESGGALPAGLPLSDSPTGYPRERIPSGSGAPA